MLGRLEQRLQQLGLRQVPLELLADLLDELAAADRRRLVPGQQRSKVYSKIAASCMTKDGVIRCSAQRSRCVCVCLTHRSVLSLARRARKQAALRRQSGSRRGATSAPSARTPAAPPAPPAPPLTPTLTRPLLTALTHSTAVSERRQGTPVSQYEIRSSDEDEGEGQRTTR